MEHCILILFCPQSSANTKALTPFKKYDQAYSATEATIVNWSNSYLKARKQQWVLVVVVVQQQQREVVVVLVLVVQQRVKWTIVIPHDHLIPISRQKTNYRLFTTRTKNESYQTNWQRKWHRSKIDGIVKSGSTVKMGKGTIVN